MMEESIHLHSLSFIDDDDDDDGRWAKKERSIFVFRSEKAKKGCVAVAA